MKPVELLAGFAKRSLTPHRDVFLGGYIDQDGAQNLCRFPEDILGDVYVTAFCLALGERRTVFVCIDNCLNIEGTNTPPGFFGDIAKAAGADPGCVFVTNTHNHQSLKYLEEPEVATILDAVRAAAADLRPARMAWTRFPLQAGVNRRPRYIVDLHLPYDEQCAVLRIRTEGRRDLLLVNYPMHNTALGVGRMENAHYLYGEAMGAAVRQLEEETGSIVYFANGFYGAAGPNVHGKNGADKEEIEEFGREQGRLIAHRLGELLPIATPETLRMETFTHRLPVNPVYGPEASETLHIRIAALGPLAFLGVDCEPYSELGAWLKAFSPFPYTILLGNANGFTGYIPTNEAFDSGPEERECRLNKTPYTRGIGNLFRKLCLDALCRTAGQTLEEQVTLRLENRGEGFYEVSAGTEEIDRLVLDFGTLSRDNCASDFTLFFGEERADVTGNGSSFAAFPCRRQRAGTIRLQVRGTYLGVMPVDKLTVTVHGLRFLAAPSSDEQEADGRPVMT